MPRPRRIPQKAWDGLNPFHFDLLISRTPRDRLREKVAQAFHNALPDEVARCLVDELLTAESLGQQRGLRISEQVDPAIAAVVEELIKMAVPYQAGDGSMQQMIPVTKLLPLLMLGRR